MVVVIFILAVREWSYWGDYGSCSVTCGHGEQYRYRTCKDVTRHTYVYVHGYNKHAPVPQSYHGDCRGPNRSMKRCYPGCCRGTSILHISQSSVNTSLYTHSLMVDVLQAIYIHFSRNRTKCHYLILPNKRVQKLSFLSHFWVLARTFYMVFIKRALTQFWEIHIHQLTLQLYIKYTQKNPSSN